MRFFGWNEKPKDKKGDTSPLILCFNIKSFKYGFLVLVVVVEDFLVDASEFNYKLRKEFGSWDDDLDEDLQPSYDEVVKNKVNSPPALHGFGEFRHGKSELVGHGRVTNLDTCGKFKKWVGCCRVELHNKVIFDSNGKLIDCRDKAEVRPVFMSCNKPTCPICYERGWAVREAKNIEFRLYHASKKFGLVEHIIVNFPPKYWGWDEDKLLKKCLEGLKILGVIGGVIIPHGFRFSKRVGWHWSPHFHVLGFVDGGFSRCRKCKIKWGSSYCRNCKSFIGGVFRYFDKTGIFHKVKGKRKSVFGTAWYQLHHASVRIDKKRSQVVRWFGVCSYRRLKISRELRKEWDEKHGLKCSICGSKYVRLVYYGKDKDIIAFYKRSRTFRESFGSFFDDAENWKEFHSYG